MNAKIQALVESIQPVDRSIETDIIDHLNDLTKPPGSLGKLEQLVTQFCLASQSSQPKIGKKIIFTFAGDHGVAAEGVSAFPQEVTPQMVANIAMGGAAVNVLGKHAGAEIRVIDMGVAVPVEFPGVIQKKIKAGTDNMAQGPAMSVEEAEKALWVGIELAQAAKEEGALLIGTGEMGIANTTPSSALFAALLPCEVEEITGRGTGINDEVLKHKIGVIKKSLKVNASSLSNPLEALAAVGGLEIAGICGLILGAAACKLPLVVDGFISSAAALVACKLNPSVEDYLFFSHKSQEAGHQTFLNKFGVEPILDLQMRLGEGTGAALAMTLIDASIKIYNEMATFSSAGVSKE
ncbi:MAG: nicotinate-nucleotide--dimethylbenzimidazole phosphoribosyltransferase [SAR324 cluster bacterium]|uniref:Nicotinate-nucleotide--dimethylbenzimidazole phosphoribosyltransferase n=1 Tax=SAR324 cluster bacterium TaxID=2024889 RepID=A0A2A4T662_9DELT|nr:MAG: nicotinate-nucleotide--dimethylbenzimidazole phosphoribosyltransferase [SAR324 cluster bacterium]